MKIDGVKCTQALREFMKQIELENPVRLLGFGISHADEETPAKYTQLELGLF